MNQEDELASAAATGNVECVGILLQDGVDVNAKNVFGRTPLQVMMMGSTIVARLLLEHGANPNVSDSSTGSTPLHDAAREGFLDTVEILIQFGADRSARDFGNRRPIDLAREKGYRDVVSYLEAL
ncbi:hypothetical protein GJAV_G00063080 [Gymnothorax javanicus]|nr:hypothetical protein GJAV_G00063080 [Gymnothorax javanicus]